MTIYKLIYPVNMLIFNSYVSFPEGIPFSSLIYQLKHGDFP